jgi:hypothetical protein
MRCRLAQRRRRDTGCRTWPPIGIRRSLAQSAWGIPSGQSPAGSLAGAALLSLSSLRRSLRLSLMPLLRRSYLPIPNRRPDRSRLSRRPSRLWCPRLKCSRRLGKCCHLKQIRPQRLCRQVWCCRPPRLCRRSRRRRHSRSRRRGWCCRPRLLCRRSRGHRHSSPCHRMLRWSLGRLSRRTPRCCPLSGCRLSGRLHWSLFHPRPAVHQLRIVSLRCRPAVRCSPSRPSDRQA